MTSLNVLGAGYAFPQTVLENDFLFEINSSLKTLTGLDELGVSRRHTSLPLTYIRETLNRDPHLAIKAAVISPTSLGGQAACMAIERAGIKIEEIGMILADCATPYEVTPGEAPRIGKELGLKVPAFDMSSSSLAFAVQLTNLSSWKAERLPRYVLCVSTNTVTHCVNYQAGNEQAKACLRFGDGAAAVVVSCQERGRMKLVDSRAVLSAHDSEGLYSDTFGFIASSSGFDVSNVDLKLAAMLEQAFAQNSVNRKQLYFIGPQIETASLKRLVDGLGLTPDRHWHNLGQRGDTLGAGGMSVLAENWNGIGPHHQVLLAVAGPGLGLGFLLLEGQ
jgi:3-oxoacyl-[acyl-carrier-protein] synthase III